MLHDLLFIYLAVTCWWLNNSPPPTRGKQSLETICLVLAYKVKYPNNFFLLRGNHECASINRYIRYASPFLALLLPVSRVRIFFVRCIYLLFIFWKMWCSTVSSSHSSSKTWSYFYRIYGFYDECKRRYNVKLWKTFTDLFNCLPLGEYHYASHFVCNMNLLLAYTVIYIFLFCIRVL